MNDFTFFLLKLWFMHVSVKRSFVVHFLSIHRLFHLLLRLQVFYELRLDRWEMFSSWHVLFIVWFFELALSVRVLWFMLDIFLFWTFLNFGITFITLMFICIEFLLGSRISNLNRNCIRIWLLWWLFKFIIFWWSSSDIFQCS